MIGKVLDNRYELVEFIGKGGMALVYRAIDRRTKHSVAVKILQPEFSKDKEFLARFEREAMTASKMSHHNIVNLLDVGQEGDLRYIVMEYVQGRTLKEVIQQKGALPPTVAAQIGIRILSALQHAHKNGIIHRDIKPQNILVHADGHVKVADFGIARVAGSSTISKADSVMGSVHYFSPEQAKGEEVTFASDLYSVGVVLYEMLTGVPPFDGDTPVAIALLHINGTPTPITQLNPAVPPALERVVEKAMEKKPEKRYQSAREMAQDLQHAMQEPDGAWINRTPDKINSTVDTPVNPDTDRHKKIRTRHSALSIAGVVALSLAIAAAMTWAAFLIYDQIVNTTEAPYLLDETEQSALRMIARAGLQARISRVSDEIKPQGTVILQSPEYGTSMRKNETVFLTVSTGPSEQPVPDCVGMQMEEARDTLERCGFLLLVLPDRVLSEQTWNTVVTQSPGAGEILASGDVVQVQLSGGMVTLPDMNGMLFEDAQALIDQLRLHLNEIREIPCDDPMLVGHVAAQQFTDGNLAIYNVGDQVMENSEVMLAVYVSANPAQPSEAPADTVPSEDEAQ